MPLSATPLDLLVFVRCALFVNNTFHLKPFLKCSTPKLLSSIRFWILELEVGLLGLPISKSSECVSLLWQEFYPLVVCMLINDQQEVSIPPQRVG